MVFVPHHLAYFTQHNALQFHPCCCKGYKLLLSLCCIEFHLHWELSPQHLDSSGLPYRFLEFFLSLLSDFCFIHFSCLADLNSDLCFHNLAIFLCSIWVFPLCAVVLNVYPVGKWGDHRAHLVCMLFFRSHSSPLAAIQRWKIVTSYVLSVFQLLLEDKSVISYSIKARSGSL